MDQNINLYEIASRYMFMAFLVGVGAGLTSFNNWVGTLGYVLMALGVMVLLVCVLGIDPSKGENKEALAQAEKDFAAQ